MRLAILQTDRQTAAQLPRHGSLAEMMGRWLAPELPGLQVIGIDAMRTDRPLPDPGDFDGFVITGSRASSYDPLPWIAPLEHYLRGLHAQARPILGICFGHQILAQALGGQVTRRGWRVGLERIRAAGLDSAEMAAARPVLAHVWHQDQVTRAPPGARLLAAYPGCPLAALGYGRHALSLQWHPEYPPDYMAEVLAAEGPACLPDPIFRAATASLGGTHDGPRVARAAARFLGWR